MEFSFFSYTTRSRKEQKRNILSKKKQVQGVVKAARESGHYEFKRMTDVRVVTLIP
jgi:hypothetical protein